MTVAKDPSEWLDQQHDGPNPRRVEASKRLWADPAYREKLLEARRALGLRQRKANLYRLAERARARLMGDV